MSAGTYVIQATAKDKDGGVSAVVSHTVTVTPFKLRDGSLTIGGTIETIFSDVQQKILDKSNDPDAKTTQRSISAHLRSRDRRKDRFMRISYLGIPPNNK